MEDQSSFLQEENERGGQAGDTKFEDLFPEPEIREFEVDLEWSETMAQWAFYLLALSRFFPDCGADWERIRDLLRQKQGRDIELANTLGQIKARRKDWGDFCAEYRHDGHNGKSWIGWIEKIHSLDWLMYCIPSTGKAWLLDWGKLQELWFQNKEEWINKYDLSPSPNPTYVTRNAGVPWILLEEAILQKIELKDATKS